MFEARPDKPKLSNGKSSKEVRDLAQLIYDIHKESVKRDNKLKVVKSDALRHKR